MALHITIVKIILVRGCRLLDDVIVFALMKAVFKRHVGVAMQRFCVMTVDVSVKVM